MQKSTKNITHRLFSVLLIIWMVLLVFLLAGGLSEVDAASKKPAKTSIIKLTGNTTVNWEKVNCSGYQVQIATNAKFSKNKKTFKVSGKNNVSKTVSSLKAGRKYYVRVRAYRKVNQRTYCSSWSKIKTIRIHNHSYKSAVTRKPTCTKTGIRTHKCSCGAFYTSQVDLVPHSLREDKICSLCRKKCAVYSYGDTKYVGPANTDMNFAAVNMTRSDGKQYIYKIHFQDSYGFSSHNEYLDKHGCAVSSLTMILNAKVPKLAYYKGNDTIQKIEKLVLGTSVFKANYKKTMNKQMPVTLYGMTKILKKYDIKHKYVYDYNKTTARKDISYHLKNGKPVIICVKDNGKWTSAYHIMTLIGFDDRGKVIIADTSYRKWSGKNQRIKYASLNEMLDHMPSSAERPTKVYWGKGGGKYGYILVD